MFDLPWIEEDQADAVIGVLLLIVVAVVLVACGVALGWLLWAHTVRGGEIAALCAHVRGEGGL